MRVYYLNEEYETGKHKIIKVWREQDGAMPEDSTKTAINVPFTVIDIDEDTNRLLCTLLTRNNRGTPEHLISDRYYVNSSGNIVENDSVSVVTINPRGTESRAKLSDLTGLPTIDNIKADPVITASISHSQSTHAPVNAQANADITKAEIEAKLTGEITTHTHAGGSGGLSQPQVMARSLGC
jgi:hypothetical protein